MENGFTPGVLPNLPKFSSCKIITPGPRSQPLFNGRSEYFSSQVDKLDKETEIGGHFAFCVSIYKGVLVLNKRKIAQPSASL